MVAHFIQPFQALDQPLGGTSAKANALLLAGLL
jgi:hypothetical protein